MVAGRGNVFPSVATDPHSSTRLLLHLVGGVLVVAALVLAGRLVRKYRQSGLKAVSAPDARGRVWTSIALIGGGFVILLVDNYFMPGGFSFPIAYACLAAMATGVLGSLYYTWSWCRLHSIAKRSA